MITGSVLTRALACPSSMVLPRAETHSPYAEQGTEDHADLAAEVMAGTLRPTLARWLPPSPRVEVKLAYDAALRTARILGDGAGDRNYGAPGPFEIFTTLDVLGVDGDAVVVLDWKTGAAEVEPAATNGQMWGGALAACRALGKDRAIVRIVYTNQGDRCDEHELDALDLAAFAERLHSLHGEVAGRQAARARGAELDTREGRWCRYCPCQHACPSKVGVLRNFASNGELVTLGVRVLTPEHARAGYEKLVAVEDLCKQARKNLEKYVEATGPLDLGGGRMYGRYSRPGNERLDGGVAVRAIAETVGESAAEFESLAVERRTSKAAIERAAKQLAQPRGTAGKVVKRIRELGGASNLPDKLPIGEYSIGKVEAIDGAVDVDAINRALESATR
jgi:hypothetical protein